MKTLVMTLLASSMLAGCAIPERVKNVRKCTLGCGTFETITDGNHIVVRSSQSQNLTIPPNINERPN